MNKEKLIIIAESIQFILLIVNYILNIVKNYSPYANASFVLYTQGSNSYAINTNYQGSIDYEKDCSNMSRSTFEKLDQYFTNENMVIWIKIQYWFFFILIGIIQIYSTVSRIKSSQNKKEFKNTKLAIFITKITFTPAVFIVTGIDYTKPCIKLQISTFFIDVALFANNIFLLALIFAVFCDCKDSKEKDLKYCCISILLIVYLITALVIYFALYFGPVLAKIENALLTLNIISDVASEIFANR